MRTTTLPQCILCGCAPEIRSYGWGILRPRRWGIVCPDIGCVMETGEQPSKAAAIDEWARLNWRRG